MKALVVALVILGQTSGAFANDRALRAQYERGIAHYRAGEFEAAIADFNGVYARKPTTDLLFNLAQAYRQAGDTTTALFFYRRYVEDARPSVVRDDAEHIIATLAVHENDPPPEPPPPPAPPPPAVVSHPVVRAIVTPPPAPVAWRSTVTRGGAVGLVASTAGIGVAMLAIGAGLAVHANSVSASLEATPPGAMWSPEYRGRYDDGHASSQASTAMLVLGAGAVATSVVSAVVLRRQLGAERPLRAAHPFRWTF